MQDRPEPVRLDRWLWAARLVKTRALAVEAIRGGRVELNGQRAKPAKEVGPGDELEITLGQGVRMQLVVRATAPRRVSAREAALLYDETEESRTAREEAAAERRLAAAPQPLGGARPTKRDRRRYEADQRARRGQG
jgi:ribosome-associated heat shock protein Hsp15